MSPSDAPIQVGELCEGRNAHTGDRLTGKLLGFDGSNARLEDLASPPNPWIVTRESLRRLSRPEAIPALFETGCCLCGAENPPHWRVDGPHKGIKYCLCATKFFGNGSDCSGSLDAEITRRKSRLSRPEPEKRVYGTCPPVGELPATLPAGTRLAVGRDCSYIAIDALTLYEKNGDFRYGEHGERYSCDGVEKRCGGIVGFRPDGVDWTTVPKSPSPQPERGEEIPGDVAELLAEARKYRPECVVEKRNGWLVLWASFGNGWGFVTYKQMEWAKFADTKRNGDVRTDDGIGGNRSELTKAIAESRVWPVEDARRLARGEQPVPDAGRRCFGCGAPVAIGRARCDGCQLPEDFAKNGASKPSQPSAGRASGGYRRRRRRRSCGMLGRTRTQLGAP